MTTLRKLPINKPTTTDNGIANGANVSKDSNILTYYVTEVKQRQIHCYQQCSDDGA